MSNSQEELEYNLRFPGASRIFYIKHALMAGMDIDQIYELTKIDRWFLDNMKEIVDFEARLAELKNTKIPTEILREAKVMGFSDAQLAKLWGMKEEDIYRLRKERNVMPEFKQVDTCAAEFEAYTPYYYSTYS